MSRPGTPATSLRREVQIQAQHSGHNVFVVFQERGPQHNREYLCHYTLTDNATGARVRIDGTEWKPNKGEAKEATAALALEHMRGWN